MLHELKRIVLGEFMEGLELEDIMSEAIGIEPSKKAVTDEKLGKDRLGEPSIFNNLGVTVLIASLTFIVIILIVVIVLWACKKAKADQRWHDRL